MRTWAISVALGAASCGPSVDADGGETGSSTGAGSSTSTSSGSTAGLESAAVEATTVASTDTSSSSSDDGTVGSSGAMADTGSPMCNGLPLDVCESLGCRIYDTTEFRYDAAAGTCTEVGPLEICAAAGGQQTPIVAWSIDAAGEIVLAALPSVPFDLGIGAWSSCSCDAGAPFACWGCDAGLVCSPSEVCSIAATQADCVALGECRWVDALVAAGDGTACAIEETTQRCIMPLAGKGDCDASTPPAGCNWDGAAPPHVRPVEGGIEIITGVDCDELAYGYMPCWSGPSDPPACDCAC